MTNDRCVWLDDKLYKIMLILHYFIYYLGNKDTSIQTFIMNLDILFIGMEVLSRNILNKTFNSKGKRLKR